jgi:hypothetical protein
MAQVQTFCRGINSAFAIGTLHEQPRPLPHFATGDVLKRCYSDQNSDIRVSPATGK